MRRLYVAATAFQLWMVIRLQVLSRNSADLLLIKGQIAEFDFLFEKIKKSNIFSHVYTSLDMSQKNKPDYYIKSKYRLLEVFRMLLVDDLVNHKGFSLSSYEEIYINYPPYLKIVKRGNRRLRMLLYNSNKIIPKIIFFDEGLSSYLWSLMRKRVNGLVGNRIFLGSPHICDYANNNYMTIETIKPLRANDQKSINVFNSLYGPIEKNMLPFDAGDIIFLEQPYSSNFSQEFVDEILSKLVEAGMNCIIKLHPRSESDKVQHYQDLGCKVWESSKIKNLPWEMILLHGYCQNTILMSLSSTAVCGHYLYLDLENKPPQSILLYPMLAERYKNKSHHILEITPELGHFFERLAGIHEDLHLIANEKELWQCIDNNRVTPI